MKINEPKTNDPLGRDPEAMKLLIAAREQIAADVGKRRVAQADIRRTIKELRAKRRAQGGSR